MTDPGNEVGETRKSRLFTPARRLVTNSHIVTSVLFWVKVGFMGLQLSLTAVN